MSFELSNDQKKSLAITVVVYALLLLLLFFLRFWPPSNMKLMGGGGGGGIEMNFGDSDYGLGDNYKSEVLNATNETKPTPVVNAADENIISDDNADDNTAVIPKTENPKKTVVEVKKPEAPMVEKPKVSKNTNDALASLLGNKGGDGDDSKGGNKGKANGSLNSNGYYGGGGTGTGSGGGNGSGNGTGTGSGTGSGYGSGNGSGSGYSLGNRKALNKPKPVNICGNESGRVAVQVTVDRNGHTTTVVSGVQGTTNTNKCLAEQAKKAAIETLWETDINAPDKQVGKIIYVFGLN